MCSDHSPEDSQDIPPPPGVGDNRQCALCLNYGDENTNVSNHPQKKNALACADVDLYFNHVHFVRHFMVICFLGLWETALYWPE